MKNKSFCAMPFIGLMLNTDTFTRYCCIAFGPKAILREKPTIDETLGEKLSIEDTSLLESWNSYTMIETRKAMLNGTKLEACANCYKQEEMGATSFRQMMTAEWENRLGDMFNNYVQEAIDNNYKISLPPVYLDLRLGNLCNLKCRMCNPWNSSQLAKEHFQLFEGGVEADSRVYNEYSKVWRDQFGVNPLYLKEVQPVFDRNFLWNEIISMIPNLKKVYMTGGEPTLIENNYRFMEECISAGYNHDIELFFNINCTNVTDKFLKLVSQFKSLKINCSLDGYEKVNDYIRYPAKWSHVEKNFRKLAELSNVDLGITPVVQVYNILDCHNLLYYADRISKDYKKNINVNFLINNHPTFLDVTIIPQSIREIGAKNLEVYRDSSDRYSSNNLVKESVDGIISLFRKELHVKHDELYKQFLTMTDILDKKRSQSFKDLIPDLASELDLYYEKLQVDPSVWDDFKNE